MLGALTAGAIVGLRWRARRRGRSAISMIDPRTILFSLPTISESLPEAERTGLAADERNAGFLHEDSWRQCELLPVGAADFVAATLQAIQRHRTQYGVGLGFREIYARPESPIPLVALGLTRGDLAAAFGSTSLFSSIYFVTEPLGMIRDSFGSLLPEIGYLYGTLQNESIGHLGVALVGTGNGALHPLSSFLSRHQLLLVDWLGGAVVMPGDTSGLATWVAAAVRVDPEAVI